MRPILTEGTATTPGISIKIHGIYPDDSITAMGYNMMPMVVNLNKSKHASFKSSIILSETCKSRPLKRVASI